MGRIVPSTAMDQHKGLVKHLDFIIADIVIVQLSHLLGTLLWNVLNDSPWAAYEERFRREAVLLLLCSAVCLLIGSPFKNVLKRNKYQEILASSRHTVNLLVLYIFLIFFTHEGGTASRLTVVYTWIIYFIAGTAFRLIWKRTLRRRILSGRHRSGSAMIVITDSGHAEEVIRKLQVDLYSQFFIKAVFLTDMEKKEAPAIASIPVLGDVAEAVKYSANHWVDEVMIGIVGDPDEAREIERHFESMGITTHRVLLKMPQSWKAGTGSVERFGNLLATTHVFRYVPLWQWGIKRFFDIVGACVGLVLTGIIFLFVAPQIYHADKGPVIYSSIRIGKNGKPFRFYKFRSMYLDADQRKEQLMAQNKMQGLMFKVDNDPRILPGIGQFIRRTSLDEFPQFWNVLKGDMSLVGTRPPTQDEWEQYEEEHRIRMTQRPGITGIWQVSGRSGVTDFAEVVRMDERYIETWTIGMDFSILLRTIAKVFQKDGAE